GRNGRSLARLCLRNVVPAACLAERFAASRSTVLVSATLGPRDSYADLLGLPLVCPRQTEAAALGAALQAAWRLGRESGAGESLDALCR
ncbi:hypothetical protein ABTD85_21130, partial [Acinetobacter baumannii]